MRRRSASVPRRLGSAPRLRAFAAPAPWPSRPRWVLIGGQTGDRGSSCVSFRAARPPAASAWVPPGPPGLRPPAAPRRPALGAALRLRPASRPKLNKKGIIVQSLRDCHKIYFLFIFGLAWVRSGRRRAPRRSASALPVRGWVSAALWLGSGCSSGGPPAPGASGAAPRLRAFAAPAPGALRPASSGAPAPSGRVLQPLPIGAGIPCRAAALRSPLRLRPLWGLPEKAEPCQA